MQISSVAMEIIRRLPNVHYLELYAMAEGFGSVTWWGFSPALDLAAVAATATGEFLAHVQFSVLFPAS